MGCKEQGAVNGRSPSPAPRHRRSPAKPRPVRVAAKSGARFVALLGIVDRATTFVALRAIIPILPATRLMKDWIRGSLADVQAVLHNPWGDEDQQLFLVILLQGAAEQR